MARDGTPRPDRPPLFRTGVLVHRRGAPLTTQIVGVRGVGACWKGGAVPGATLELAEGASRALRVKPLVEVEREDPRQAGPARLSLHTDRVMGQSGLSTVTPTLVEPT